MRDYKLLLLLYSYVSLENVFLVNVINHDNYIEKVFEQILWVIIYVRSINTFY